MTTENYRELSPALTQLLKAGLTGKVVVLTGAVISAESGIPTFRGEEGYWTVGSKHYQPQELATHEAFEQMPEEIWAWYLYRRSVCRAAGPNRAHHALVELEETLGDRFTLVTQNVDGLHLQAGNSLARTYQIHGNIDYMRFEQGDTSPIPMPEEIDISWDKTRKLTAEEITHLKTDERGWARPHVLWFDEYYDEELFHFESSLKSALEADLLIVVGTSGQTNLPVQMGAVAVKRKIPLVIVNQDDSSFTELLQYTPKGYFAQGTAGEYLPAVVNYLKG